MARVPARRTQQLAPVRPMMAPWAAGGEQTCRESGPARASLPARTWPSRPLRRSRRQGLGRLLPSCRVKLRRVRLCAGGGHACPE
eukprot:6622812-Prymnesium_polylepis.1